MPKLQAMLLENIGLREKIDINLQKGYEQFYPSCGGIKTTNTNKTNIESMFYDSGWTQLAKVLFIRNVFLPKISFSEIKK